MPFINSAILAQMQSEVWLMEPRRLSSFFLLLESSRTGNMILENGEALFPESPKSQVQDTSLKVNNGVASIPIRGILLKEEIPFLAWFGIESTTYPQIISRIAQALGDDDVKSIMLEVDSPGGQVAGGNEAALAISNANKQKPVSAHISDLGASGAFWLASQAGHITANPNAIVGSIGVFWVFVDSSKQAESEGVEVKVIRSGDHKGMGIPGAPISDEQVTAIQKVVDGLADNFIKAVASGRDMKVADVRSLADGRVWLASEALKLNLIDGLQIDSAGTKTTGNNTKGKIMAEKDAQNQEASPTAEDLKKLTADATAAEQDRFGKLEAAFPGETDFVVAQYKAGSNVDQAKLAFNAVLTERLAESKKENAELKAKQDEQVAGETASPGAEAILHGELAQGGEDFMATAKTLAADKKIGMRDAMKQVARENPDLHAAFLAKQQPRQKR